MKKLILITVLCLFTFQCEQGWIKDILSPEEEELTPLEVVVAGCTDDTACNYNSEATEDDGTCLTIQDCFNTLQFSSHFNNSSDINDFLLNQNQYSSLSISDGKLSIVGENDGTQHRIEYIHNAINEFKLIVNMALINQDGDDKPFYGILIKNEQIMYLFEILVSPNQYYTAGLVSYSPEDSEFTTIDYKPISHNPYNYLEFTMLYTGNILYCYIDNSEIFQVSINDLIIDIWGIYTQRSHTYSIDSFYLYKK